MGLFIGNWAHLIDVGIVEEVLRGFGKVFRQLFDELCLVLDEEAIIFRSLGS